MPFSILGQKITEPVKQLETFPAPDGVRLVRMVSDEFTSLCPVTGQPDFCMVTIEYVPSAFCIESKSLKLYLWTFRERGAFCEALAAEIAEDVYVAIAPQRVKVMVTQKPRGGIALTAEAIRE